MRKYEYLSPETLDGVFQAAAGNADKEVKMVAGCTDFMPRLSAELEEIPAGEKPDLLIVSLMKLGLDRVEDCGGTVKIGACCTLTDLAENPLIQKEFPVLTQAIAEIAGLTVRNAATLGGNIVNASPAADSVPALMALGAKLVAERAGGTREYDIEDFFTGPGGTVLEKGEVLTAIVIPKRAGKGCFKKLGRRKAETLSTVNAAAYVESENGVCTAVRVAVGAVAPTVVRCTEAEAALLGKELTAKNIAAAAEKVLGQISPIDDIRASAWYRRKVAPVLVRRVLEHAV
ncbi:MAG: xanthine dehydrogenase family protein subunit M [Oscillibacter sp.]|nr:xanthine dehydrogenase family protein subunit M [Oscillibacter sp.]